MNNKMTSTYTNPFLDSAIESLFSDYGYASIIQGLLARLNRDMKEAKEQDETELAESYKQLKARLDLVYETMPTYL